jgi:hypothetical protein
VESHGPASVCTHVHLQRVMKPAVCRGASLPRHFKEACLRWFWAIPELRSGPVSFGLAARPPFVIPGTLRCQRRRGEHLMKFTTLLLAIVVSIIRQRVGTYQLKRRIDRLGVDLTARIDRLGWASGEGPVTPGRAAAPSRTRRLRCG